MMKMTMTNSPTPWDEIREPDADYNVRRVAGGGQVPLYWAKDSHGRCLFVVELEGSHVEQFRKEGVRVHGISVDLRKLGASANEGLVLTLERHIDKDLFKKFCETLVAALQPVTDSPAALALALAHIKRWKAFLAGHKGHILSAEEVRGLFGEVLFLRELYQHHIHEAKAMEAWRGPQGGHQDFVFGSTAVEVKALSGRDRSTVRISSEDQLETLSENLFLVTYQLTETAGTERSCSLSGLIHKVQSELSDAEAIEELSKRLASYGYIELQEYEAPEFVVRAKHAYRVTESFPRLIRSRLPDGILRLAYEIQLEKIAAFECDPSEIWEA
jgi:hypothetical protein